MSTAANTSTDPGQAVYNPLVLSIYDLWVLQFSCSFVWRCSASRLLAHYNKHVTRRHLDVGVGTGYFLKHAEYPVASPDVTLFDLNENSLRFASSRIASKNVTTVRGDVLEPNSLPRAHFESIGLNFLFHCLPDGGAGKWRALDHLLPTLAEGGKLFGSTILADHLQNPAQRYLAGVYNKKGVFSNTQDTSFVLESELSRRFKNVEIEHEGVVGLFLVSGIR